MRINTYILIFFGIICCDNIKREVLLEFEDGTVSVERVYVNRNSKNEYKYIEYHKNGKVKFEGYVKDGFYRGTKKSFYENGDLDMICHLADSGEFNYCYPDGAYELYLENGILGETHYRKKGLVNGLVISYDSTGNKMLEIEVVNDLKNGTSKEYFSNGNLYSIKNYENDTLIGQVIIFNEKGDTAIIHNTKNGELELPLKYWDQNGTFFTGQYIDEKGDSILWEWRNAKNEVYKTEIGIKKNGKLEVPKIL